MNPVKLEENFNIIVRQNNYTLICVQFSFNLSLLKTKRKYKYIEILRLPPKKKGVVDATPFKKASEMNLNTLQK